jgi:hypothetical protein
MLVNKLCALLGRSEIRDLGNVEALVSHGVSLPDAIDAAQEGRRVFTLDARLGASELQRSWVGGGKRHIGCRSGTP